MRKLGLIAGGGGLPLALARHCVAGGRPLYVIRLAGFASAQLEAFDGESRPLIDIAGGLAALKREGCEAVCFAGAVERPDFESADAAALPETVIAARGGDDSLLSAVIARFQAEGFSVEGAHEVMADLTLGAGPLGRLSPADEDTADIDRALLVARTIGALDVGQGAVCRDGSVLAVEAREGTDAMLRRVADFARGADRRGVLAKASKPGQDLRIDLPTIGPTTVELAAAAGLSGIIGEAGRVLVVDRAETIRLADASGLFIAGVPAS
jgi:DUF1009 family protein